LKIRAPSRNFGFVENTEGARVRALQVLHDRLRESNRFVHTARWNALWRTVLALIAGKKLWLTALGRALPGQVERKHAIKAVDRLLGNPILYCERKRILAGLAAQLVGRRSTVLVLVDTVEIRHKVVGFVASIGHEGRAIPIWSTMISAFKANPRHCRTFLSGLREVLPANCRPVLITDAGFESAWYDQVAALGWDYIGRLRGLVKVEHRGERLGCHALHAMASQRARNLAQVRFPLRDPKPRRLVLSKLPVCRHRQVRTRTGPARGTNYHLYRKNAYEPLILTTSLSSNAQAIVDLYNVRMQIEQTFRDLKNHRWGWSLRHCLSRHHSRLELLLLIGALATFVQQVIGIAAEAAGAHRRYQANTIKSRRVLSYFVLGGLIITSPIDEHFSSRTLMRAMRHLRQTIAGFGPKIR
jgi:hypothetical protein